jgi:hypothetical protein
MSEHHHYIKNAVLKSFVQLRDDLQNSIAGKSDPLGPNTLDVRQLSIAFDHTPTNVRRVYIQATDSSSLSSVGWVTNESVPVCMDCLRSFSLFTRRHHCRACGAVTCKECCNVWATLKDFEELGKVRVCHRCNPTVSVQQGYRRTHLTPCARVRCFHRRKPRFACRITSPGELQ